MANNFQITTLNEQGATTVLHPESNADQVLPGTNTKVPLRTEIANWNEKAQEIESARDGKTNLKEKIDDVVTKLTSNIQAVRTDLEKDVSLLDNKTAAEDASLSRRMDGIRNNLQTQVDTWNDFKANGGTVGGDIKVPSLSTFKNDMAFRIRESNGIDNKISMFLEAKDTGERMLYVAQDNVDLGVSSRPWKDIYLSGDNKPRGYTKLANGNIYQFIDGIIRYNGGNAQINLDLPISFKERIVFLGIEQKNNPYSQLCDWNLKVRRIAGSKSKIQVELCNIKNTSGLEGNEYEFTVFSIGF